MSSDARPSSPLPSGVGRRRCSTCRVRLQRTDQHSSCFMEESERRRAYHAAAAPRPDSSQDEESETNWAPLDLPPVPAEWGDCEDGEISEVGSLLTLDEVVSNPELDRFPLDHMPGLYSTAAAIMDAPLPPQPTQRVEDFTSGYATTRGRRRTQPTLCPRMDPIVHYATREWPKPLAAKRPALGYGMCCNVQDWSWTGGVPDIEDSVRMALHPSASVWPGTRLLLPSERDRTSLAMHDRCYANAAQVVAVANNMAFITGALDRSLSSGQALSGDTLSQARTTSAAILRMCQALAVDGGRTMAAAQVGVRHLWLGLANIREAEKRQLLDLPISQTSLFGPDMQTLVARLETAAKDSASLAQHLAPRREARPPARGAETEAGSVRPGGALTHIHAPWPIVPPRRGPRAQTGTREARGTNAPTVDLPMAEEVGVGRILSIKADRHFIITRCLSLIWGPAAPRAGCAVRYASYELRFTGSGYALPERGQAEGSGARPPLHEARARGGHSSRVTCGEQSYKANTGFPTPGARPPLHEARARGGHSSRVTCGEQSRTYDVGPAGHVTAPGAHAPVPPLTDFYSIWREQGLDDSIWLEKTLRRGYALQFFRKPPPFRGVRAVRSQVRGSIEALQAEVSSLLSRGAAVEVDPQDATRGLYSPYFLVPKKSGGVRPILDLRVLNECISKRQFRMLSTKQLLECVRQGDWMSSIDLTDAYFHVPIVPEHRRFLRFAVGERNYEYCRLPFGYALAPRTFSKCVEAALEPLRRAGVRILTYIDDWLILASSREVAVSHTHWVLSRIQRLGFVVNREKSKLQPAQRMIYLGLQFRRAPESPLGRLRSLLGMMAAAHAVVRLGLLHMRNFQRWFSRLRLHPSRDGGRLIWVPQVAASDIRFWLTPGLLRDGVTLACAVRPAGDGGSAQSTAALCSSAAGETRDGALRQHHSGLLSEQAGGHQVPRSPSHGDGDAAVGGASPPVSQGAPRPGGPERGGRQDVQGGLTPGRVGPGPAGSCGDLAEVRPSSALFASAENAQCPSWFALRAADELPLGVDALAHYPWPGGLLYTFPPVRLLPVLLRRIEQERRSVFLVAPDSPHARWFPFLRGMAVMEPWALPDEPGALVQGGGALFSRPIIGRRLWVWRLRGGTS
uniref:ribonuclease H n=1 Tax=Knipowitschia caucasica TaxID=637954 RepID=A0AAV2LLV6_KNICA